MNKTVIININGIIFHIEEDAFDKLSKYLNTIKGYFKDSDGRDEIMSDIEARIAELLQEKVNAIKQVVILADVDEVIAKMGKPEEYATDADTESTSGSTHSAGSANATNSTYTSYKRRRVFRDPDDKILGGVCSGIANHFDFDPLYLRGTFAVLFFAFGTGLLLYILLWIIIPKAETTAEKLEMRGEPINVDNIKRSVEEEMSDLKNRVNNIRSQTNVRTGIDKIIDFVSTVVKGFFRIIMRVLSVFFITIGFILLFVLISSVFGFTNFVHTSYEGKDIAYSLHDLMMALFSNGFQLDLTKLGLLLFIGVPLIMLIYNGIKILFKMHTQNRIVKITSLVLWLSGLIILLYVGSQIGSEFKEETEFKETAKISAPVKNGVLYLNALKDNKYNFEEKFGYQSRVKIDGWNLVKINEKGISFGFPMLRVEKSDTDSFELAITKVASGFDKKEAVMRARSINYEFAQHDSVIDFSSCFDISKDAKWRNQNVQLVLKVPVGKTIYINRNMKHIINDIDNVTNTWDGDMVSRRWIMTADGLKCVDCEGLNRDNDDENHERKHHIHINRDGTTIDIDTDAEDWDSLNLPEPPPAPPVKGIKKV